MNYSLPSRLQTPSLACASRIKNKAIFSLPAQARQSAYCLLQRDKHIQWPVIPLFQIPCRVFILPQTALVHYYISCLSKCDMLHTNLVKMTTQLPLVVCHVPARVRRMPVMDM